MSNAIQRLSAAASTGPVEIEEASAQGSTLVLEDCVQIRSHQGIAQFWQMQSSLDDLVQLVEQSQAKRPVSQLN
jgi:hypothetical protein